MTRTVWALIGDCEDLRDWILHFFWARLRGWDGAEADEAVYSCFRGLESSFSVLVSVGTEAASGGRRLSWDKWCI